MKGLKIVGLALCSCMLITGCGEESASEDESSKKLSCEYSSDFLSEENSIELTFEDDKISEGMLKFGSATGFDQDYADSVCDSYEMNDGISCSATVENEDEDDVYTTYELTGNSDEGIRAMLSQRESIEGTTLEEIKAALEEADYVCE